MKNLIRLTAIIMILTFVSLSGVIAQGDGNAQMRFVHVIPGVTALDIYTDGQLSVSGLEYGEASGYIALADGPHEITVRSSGLTNVLWQQQVNATAAIPKVLVAASIDPLEFAVFDDDLSSLSVGTSRFSVIHVMNGVASVDVMSGENTVATGMAYRSIIGTFDVPVDNYDISVVDGALGSYLLSGNMYGLASNTSHVFVIYGTQTMPEMLLLSAPTVAEAGSGFLRLAHSIPGVSEIDIYLDGTKIAANLAFGAVTEHLPVASGDHTLTFQTADGSVSTEAAVTVNALASVTVVAMGSPDAVMVGTLADDMTGIDADNTLISVANTINNSTISVSLADGTVLADSLEYGSSSAIVTVEPTFQAINFTLTIGDQSATLEVEPQVFYGGVYYNVIAVEGTLFSPHTLVIASTGKSQGIASAPGADIVIVAAPPVQQATEAPAAAQPEVVVTEAPVVNPPPPTISSTRDQLIGLVELNPGANLQLRQFPRQEALSLGLVPSGSYLDINGREGAPIDYDNNVIQMENSDGVLVDFIDPATYLDPNDPNVDLEPVDTWLNVTYHTPDGGEITAWVNALYLDIDRFDGKPYRLVLLPMIARNIAGQAINTAITPPPIPEDRIIMRVIGLDPGANLNLRRTPDIQGEILARLPNGTVAEFIGIGGSEEWGFIQYTPPEGGLITGWVSITYLEYEFNGEAVDLDDLRERDRLVTIDEEIRRGEISADTPASVGAAPTRNPLRDAYVGEVIVNPGANLNLRRSPDVQSEILVRIPSGADIIITGRTIDSVWFYTEFEGQSGWVAGDPAYVTVTYNGIMTEIEMIPVLSDVVSPTEEPDSNG